MKNRQVDFGILLTIATTSAGVWYYFLEYIISLPKKESTFHFLLGIGWLHWVLFLIVVFSVIAIYLKGIVELIPNTILKSFENQLIYVLTICWLPLISFSFFLLFLLMFNGGVIFSGVFFWRLVVIGILLITVFGIYFLVKYCKWKLSLYILSFLFFGYLYSIVMSEVFASISITTDKEFYSKEDVLRCCIQRSGYIYLPGIKYAKFQSVDLKVSDTVQAIAIDFSELDSTLVLNPSNNYITVVATTQWFGNKRVKNHHVSVTK